jgi:flavin-dependent dehydrogenase
MTADWDVIVIGAGPAGSVAARQLALRGRRVLLLDKKRFPRRKVCGACLNYSAVTLLDEIGLGGVLRDGDGPEIRRFELRADSRRLSLPLPSGRAISRAALDQRLVDAAIRAGVVFHDGTTATVEGLQGGVRFVDVNGSRLSAQVVLAADGLGHPSLHSVAEIRDRVVARSRIGAGCEVREFPSEYASGVIHMAVGRGGYVGLVRVEEGTLNIAAAFDARLVRETGGPARAAAVVLAQAGFPEIPVMAEADWLGTPALTRTTSPVAAERLFVLGDASGYVEPFTGEGIGWGLASAVALAPLADAACTPSWQPSFAAAWSREHTRLVRHRQRVCQSLAMLLKSPTCVRLAMCLASRVPLLLKPLVRGVSLPARHSLSITRCG